MSVMVGVQIKDAEIWLPRYLRCLDHLEGDINRVVFIYGKSADATLSILLHWKNQTSRNVEIYQEPYLPPEERRGYMLARPKRDFQTLLKEDYFFLCDPDIVDIPPDTVSRLIADEKDVVAPYVWTEGRTVPTFFDSYGFRKDECKFHPYRPPGLLSKEPIEVDSVGSCYLATKEAMEKGVYTNPFPHIAFCMSLQEQGMKVWADPQVHVIHVDLEKYGIYHYPPSIPLTQAPFLTYLGEKVNDEQLRFERSQQARVEYENWVNENHPPHYQEWFQEFQDSRPLITACYKVLNEAEYLKYSLESIYSFVDEINIVEGAVKKAMHATLDGTSTDGTVEIIKTFPDPENKIRLIQGRWQSKEEVQAKLLEYCRGHWMMYIDGDELYLQNDLEQIRGFCKTHLDGKIVYAIPGRTLNFWHDFKHIAYSLNELSPWGKHQAMHPFLIWRGIPGLNFPFHTIPVDGYGRIVNNDPFYENRRATLNNVMLYHYGCVKSEKNMRDKLLYQKKRGLGEVKGEIDDDMWFSGEMPSDFVLKKFRGEPPLPLKKHPFYGNRRIKITQTKPVYKFERLENEEGSDLRAHT